MDDSTQNPETLYLYMFPRNIHTHIPNMSPFAMKIETWLRMENVEYQVRALQLN